MQLLPLHDRVYKDRYILSKMSSSNVALLVNLRVRRCTIRVAPPIRPCFSMLASRGHNDDRSVSLPKVTTALSSWKKIWYDLLPFVGGIFQINTSQCQN